MRDIELDEPELDDASKRDHSPPLIERLIARGTEKGSRFLAMSAP